MKRSIFGTIGVRDILNGVFVAFAAAALTGIVSILDAGELPTLAQLKSAGVVGVTAALSYLLKNVLSNSQGELAKLEPNNAGEIEA